MNVEKHGEINISRSHDVRSGRNVNALLKTGVFKASTKCIHSKSMVLFTPEIYVKNFSRAHFFSYMKISELLGNTN